MTTAPTFKKEERIVSNLLIETLFEKGNSQSLSAYPLRAVYLRTEHRKGCAPVQLLISVPKKKFKHAVDRNRVKRQIREAIIWLSDKHYATNEVEKRVINLLKQMAK